MLRVAVLALVVVAAFAQVDPNIDKLRRGDIHITVNGGAGSDVQIRVHQTKKSFPFGTCVNAGRYNNAGLQGYRNFIFQHFNWAVPENCLKWQSVEPNRGQANYDSCLRMIDDLRTHGIKVRGHNLIWPIDQWIPNWLKSLSTNDIRSAVTRHVQEAMGKTRGKVEHWDAINENLHGQWFEQKLGDPNYSIAVCKLAHSTDPSAKIFINDYNVVSQSYSTNAFLQEAQKFKQQGGGCLYGLGAQSHFDNEVEPDANAIKQRLDTLAQSGYPIWITELDVQASDANRRANFYEKALTAVYGHPAVEGILIWGFWDQEHWRGEKASLVNGNNFQVNAAGQRVIDLLEKRWMTDETHSVAQSGNSFTVRGFHGDYELIVTHQGRQSKQTFSLNGASTSVTANVP